jgi:hypothetical protein
VLYIYPPHTFPSLPRDSPLLDHLEMLSHLISDNSIDRVAGI